jgi:hypothetical protein
MKSMQGQKLVATTYHAIGAAS